MKTLLWLLVTASLVTVLTGCDVHFSNGWSDADLTAVTNVVQTAAIPAGIKRLTVDNHFGFVHVTGTDSLTNTWTWKLTVRATNSASARQIANAASCQAVLNGDQLDLVVSLPDTSVPHSIQSDLEISVPKAIALTTRNHFGPTEIANLAGDVDATGQNGRLDLQNISGGVTARTSFDSLNVTHTGPATLKDQNGQIKAIDIKGPLEAQTSFDSLIAKTIAGAATLRDQNGSIEAADIDGSLDAKTSFDSLAASNIGGSARLRDQNGSIKMIHVKGDADIETSFDNLQVEEVGGDALLMNQNGSVVARGIAGSVKATTSFADMDITGQGSKFVCHNQNGDIHLHATSVALTNVVAHTSFATLEVHLATALKPAIQARTSFADVESDFPVLMKPPGEDPFADIAPDTARITLENQNGKIGIVRD